MAHIIGLIQAKGGTGRSTIATNLAGMFAEKYQTVLIDCDMPQTTSFGWYLGRQLDGKQDNDNLSFDAAHDHDELVRKVLILNRVCDVIVIDAPPRIAEITRSILIMSQLCLVPLGGSATEIKATYDLLETIAEAKAIKPDVDARIVWTRIRAGTKSAQQVAEDGVRLGLKELHSRLGYRAVYSDALAEGLTVMECRDRVARKEMMALGQEVGRILNVECPEARISSAKMKQATFQKAQMDDESMDFPFVVPGFDGI